MEAYVDESARDGQYVMAAVLVRPERAEEIRAALREALRRGQRRYHWHDENTASRQAMVRRIAELGLDAVAVRTREDGKPERARRQCLLRLLGEVTARGATSIVIESRQRRGVHDRRVIAAVQRFGGLPADLAYRFSPPDADALLWVADVVAGAAAAAVGGQDRTYLEAVGVLVVPA